MDKNEVRLDNLRLIAGVMLTGLLIVDLVITALLVTGPGLAGWWLVFPWVTGVVAFIGSVRAWVRIFEKPSETSDWFEFSLLCFSWLGYTFYTFMIVASAVFSLTAWGSFLSMVVGVLVGGVYFLVKLLGYNAAWPVKK